MAEIETQMFDIVIDNKLYSVYERNETHELGRMNGCPDSWWLKYNNEWIPYIDKMVNRPCFEINVKQNNHIKDKWNTKSLRGTCSITIKCNLRTVYQFNTRDIEYGLAKAQVLISDMTEHPFNFMDPESEIGRKIWFYDQPGSIEKLLLEQGCVMIKYEGNNSGFNLKQNSDTEIDIINEWNGEKLIKEDIFSTKISWFRK